MNKSLIVKHNKIIESKYNMTTTEIKIVAKLTSLIKKDDEDFKEYTFSSKNLLKELNLGSENYSALEDSINKLIGRVIEIEKEDGRKLVTTFLSSCLYDNTQEESTITLSYDPKLKPYFFQLKDNFTKYHLENILELKSFYAIRIYELLKQYETIKERTMLITDLKEILDVKEKSYNIYNRFKERVILKSQEEINEKTDINIDFEEIKTGRKVTSLRFLISPKQKEIKLPKIKKPKIIQTSLEEPEERDFEEAQKEFFRVKESLTNKRLLK